jgi:hypothetical protein
MHISGRSVRGWLVKHIGRIIGAALMAVVVGACSGRVELGELGETAGGDAEAAAGMVDRWFELARSDQGVGWSAFSYEVVASRLHDGEYGVDVHVAGGVAGVPETMRGWGLIQFSLTDGQPSEIGVMKLEIPPFGEGGFLGIGGRQLGR